MRSIILLDDFASKLQSGKRRDGGAADAVTDWLTVRGMTPGALLCPVNKAGRITLRRLSDQAVLDVLQKRAQHAKVKPFSPHDLRRTFISDLLTCDSSSEVGADV